MTIPVGNIVRLAAAALAAYGRPRIEAMAIPAGIIIAMVCSILAVWLGLAAFACSAAAVWIFVQPSVGTLGAALITAGVLLIACLILAVVASVVLRSKRKADPAQAVPASSDQLLAQGLRLFKEHKGAVLLAALVAGMVSETHSRP